jgi:hypothetical protein
MFPTLAVVIGFCHTSRIVAVLVGIKPCLYLHLNAVVELTYAFPCNAASSACAACVGSCGVASSADVAIAGPDASAHIGLHWELGWDAAVSALVCKSTLS